ncbi:ABC transporter permease [Pelagibius sp. Alg239-R121]|uniref:ABC transporter permease n=1 Tax=Pelagibius sp. Alg239-R121 TaxID=2993448 RepID=UPI0024A679AB|nr:ABC transporter permease [Pelagibius sp. Alg239-R121]
MAQVEASGPMLDAAGVPLKASLARAERRNRLKALGLVFPLLAFILITFVYPIALMVFRGVDNPTVSTILPKTAEILRAWDGNGLPGDEAFVSLAGEFAFASKERTLGKVATRLNYELAGSRSLVTKSGRKLKKLEAPTKEDLVEIDKRWSQPETWSVLKRLAEPYTFAYYLAAIDKTYDVDGTVVDQPESRQIYVALFMRTLWVSLLITGLCVLLAYPIAYLMAILPTKTSNLLMIMVLLPFWTSLLVRTSSWIVLLQTEGVLNDILVWTGIIGEDGRIQMIYNMTGTVVAMVHILLPFMVLPLFSVMKTISPTYMRAAKSLGATPARAFWTVYFPQTVPGIGAGSILVFILAIGYYITPALVGGRTGQLISNFIAYHMQQSLNWGLAAALGGILLAGVLALYWIYNRLVGIDNMKLG